MRATEKRMRSITFRISRDEYLSVSRLSAICGARSLSDYMRTVLARIVATETPENIQDPCSTVLAVERLITEAQRELKHLAMLLERGREASAREAEQTAAASHAE